MRPRRLHFPTGHPAAGQQPARDPRAPPGLFSGNAKTPRDPSGGKPPFGMTLPSMGAAVRDDIAEYGGRRSG